MDCCVVVRCLLFAGSGEVSPVGWGWLGWCWVGVDGVMSSLGRGACGGGSVDPAWCVAVLDWLGSERSKFVMSDYAAEARVAPVCTSPASLSILRGFGRGIELKNFSIWLSLPFSGVLGRRVPVWLSLLDVAHVEILGPVLRCCGLRRALRLPRPCWSPGASRITIPLLALTHR